MMYYNLCVEILSQNLQDTFSLCAQSEESQRYRQSVEC